MATPPRFDGAVLCGGASRRMGRDKALIPIDGQPMVERVARALTQAGAASVTLVGGDMERFSADFGITADRWPGEGPLGGVITALGSAGTAPVVAVLACDLVSPDPAAVTDLMAARDAADCDVAVAVSEDRVQWTHAVWHRRVERLLTDRFEAGDRALHAAVHGLSVVTHTIDPAATTDADRPEDLPRRGR